LKIRNKTKRRESISNIPVSSNTDYCIQYNDNNATEKKYNKEI